VKRHLVVAHAALLSMVPRSGSADMTKLACIDANTGAQDARREGKLASARDQLRACTDPSCPAIVRSDCIRRLDELQNAQPTIVFEVKDGAGNDRSDVQITVDGAPLVDKLDGTALEIDPGEHVFVFLAAGQSPASRRLVLTEAQKERHERVVLSAAPADRVTADTHRLAAPAGGRVPGLVLGGVGLAGLALGSVFGVLTFHEVGVQHADCPSAGSCVDRGSAQAAHSAASTDGTIATVSLAAGAALVGAGVALYLGARSPGGGATGVVLTPGVGGMTLAGSF
jgi:hypothetical protein